MSAKSAPKQVSKKASKKKLRQQEGPLVRAAKVPCGFATGVTGKPLLESTTARRIGWLGQLTANACQAALNQTWNPASFAAFTDPDLPSQAFVAWEQAFGRPPHPLGAHMNSRATRVALARAGELVRSQEHKRELCDLHLGGWPDNATEVEARSLRAQLVKFRKTNGRLPVSFFELNPEPPQVSAHIVSLGPADFQLRSWKTINNESAVLRIKLPLRELPTKRSDWGWHELTIKLPPLVRRRLSSGGKLMSPTLLLVRGRVVVVLVTQEPRPPALTCKTEPELAPKIEPLNASKRRSAPVLGLDFGVRRWFTGSFVWPHEDGVARTDGRPVFFDAKGAQAHLELLRRQAKELVSKRDRKLELAFGRTKPDPVLLAEAAAHDDERKRVWAHYDDLQTQLKHSVAKWAVEQARAHGCRAIVIEDLDSMQVRSHSADLNARVNHQMRSQVFDAISDKAAEHGIALIVVPARNTSKLCPRCLAEHKHVRASNDLRSGRSWAVCAGCGHSGDRDHAAAERIAAIGLTGNTKAQVRRARRPAFRRQLTRRGRRQRRAEALLLHQGQASPPQLAGDIGKRGIKRAAGAALPRPATAEPLPIKPLPSSPSPDPWACSAGRAASVRRGGTPREPALVVVAGDQLPKIARSSMSSRASPHQRLGGMSKGLTGHARFTLPERETRPIRFRPKTKANSRTW